MSMAQEGSEASVASTTNNWWDNIHSNSLSSWNNINSWQQQQQQPPNPSSNSCEEDISISATSFTNASNHSGLSVGSSSATDLSGEQVENPLWSHVLLSVGNGGNLHSSSHGDGENFLEALSSKSLSTDQMFEPACDYLKKLDGSWEFANSERPTSLSDLVSNWSIAPPQPQFENQNSAATSTTGLLEPNFSQIKHEMRHTSDYTSCYGMGSDQNAGFFPCYGHEMKGEGQQQDFGGAPQPPFLRPLGSSDGRGYQVGLRNSILGVNSKYYSGNSDGNPWSNTRNFSDLITFGGSISKQLVDCRAPKPCLKGLDSVTNSKKQVHESSLSTRGNLKGTGNSSEGKKKRSEDNSEALLKKSKHESSNSPSSKLQVPKVKLGDKITALQQIVSPFGKTDTASVLLEAINYISFLHEQVQLLSDPYIKSGANKEHNSWGGMERKDKQERKVDLSSRGLCLVPIACTPQVYRENTGPDYWTPTYRGCLYR